MGWLASCGGASEPPAQSTGPASINERVVDVVDVVDVVTQEPVNFIVFDIDSLRSDHLDGGPGPPPNLAWLKNRGTLFSRTYPPAGWTLPSLVSMLAGRVAPAEALLPEVDPTQHRLLPGILAAYGYHTGVAWGDTLLDRHPRRLSWMSGDTPATDYGTAAGFAAAIEAGAVAEPFFVLLHDEDLHTALMGRHLGTVSADRAVDLARQQYRQALVDYDQQVGLVLSALWSTERASRTVVVVLSDHGEALYEHGELGHGDLLWEEVTRVPMLIVDPVRQRAQKVGEPVSTLDLAPTILARAGIPIHGEMRGRSLLPALQGRRLDGAERAFVLDSDMEAAAVIVGTDKLVAHPHGCMASERVRFSPLQGMQCVALYDLSSDPGETTDRSDVTPERRAQLTAALRTGLQARTTPALEEYAEFLSELQQRGYWEAVEPR